VKLRPSDKILQMEKSIVKRVFRTAMSVITPAQIPYFERVKAKTNGRPVFIKWKIAKLEKIHLNALMKLFITCKT
jgi:hypothetical protein